ncbi:hypothetical protein P9112_003690 [Eukaryota sp. TZLM1-RC]
MTDIPADVLCETLVDKLLLLDYEERFCYPKEFPLLNPFYFLVPAPNRSEQYYYFVSLAVWLFRICGIDAAQPFQSDDPGTISQNLLSYCREASLDVDIDPAKLRQGFGDAPCLLLTKVVELAISKSNITYGRPEYPNDNEQVDSDPDTDISENIEEVPDFQLESEGLLTSHDIIGSDIKAISEWKAEVERVLPRLQLSGLNDNVDFNARISVLAGIVTKCLSIRDSMLPYLFSYGQQTQQILEKITSREAFVHDQMQHLVEEYSAAKKELESIQFELAEKTKIKSEKLGVMTSVGRQLEEIKEATDRRGAEISNTEPLVELRKDKQSLVENTKNLTLRLAVTEQTLLRLRERHLEKSNTR